MHIHTEYPKAWDSMLEDCRNAKRYIYLEQFILQDFGNNEIGGRMLAVLKQKASEGVKIKMLIDVAGSKEFYFSTFLQDEVIAAGIELEFFGIVPRWKGYFPFNMFHRDHRKILVIDDAVAHVGGIILREIARDWRDIDVRIDDIRYIAEIKGAFLKMWDEVRGNEDHKNQYDKETGLILKNNPEHNELYETILAKVKSATSHITIVTPYLSPNWKMSRALKAAGRRGVEVNIILPEK